MAARKSSDLSTLLAWFELAHMTPLDLAHDAKALPSTLSPELDAPDAAAGDAAPGAERPKLKLHSCAQCELPVAARFEEPEPWLRTDARVLTVLGESELSYLPQHGPVCGAASVAGTALSLALHHGVDAALAHEAITVRLVQDVYNALGVPNIYKSSVAVGNLTIKKCLMALRVPGL